MTTEQKKEWDEEASRIDSEIKAYIADKNWEQYLPQGDGDTESFRAFCRHLVYVISKFLEEEERDSRELFIEVPIEEFIDNNNPTLQDSRWKQVAESIMANLMLATAQSMYNRTFLSNLTPTNDGDKFLLYDRRGRFHFARYDQGQLRNISNNGIININNVLLDPGLIKVFRNFNNITNNIITDCIDLRRIYLSLQQNANTAQYNSAALVSYNNMCPTNMCLSTGRPVSWQNILDLPIKFTSNYQTVTNCDANYDIIIVLGDEKYRDVQNRYQNTRAKKIVYIGSKKPSNNNNIKTYSFTFREMYRYCGQAELVAPTCIELEFPWLEGKQQELRELLTQCKQDDTLLTDDIIENCVHKLTYQFTNALFDDTYLERLKKFNDVETIYQNYLELDDCIETNEKVYEWYQNLTFDGINPKKQYFSKHPECLTIAKWNDSYKNRVKLGHESSIILDAPSCSSRDNAQDKRYLYILRYHMFANITALYYKGLEDYSRKSLEYFFQKELAQYNDQTRKDYKTNFNLNIHEIGNSEEFDMDKYLEKEYSTITNIYKNGRREDFIQYKVTFTDQSSEKIDGELLVDFGNGYERIDISDLYNDPNYKVPAIFYLSPSNLKDLRSVGLGIPKEDIEKIDSYSTMWKQAYQTAFKKYSEGSNSKKGTVSRIYEKCKISRICLYLYSLETKSSQFLQKENDMKEMCNFLISEGCLSQEEMNHIMNARQFVGKFKSFGRNLKNIVLDLKLGEDTIPTELRSIREKLLKEYSKEDLLGRTLHYGIISNIEIVTSKTEKVK